MKAWFLRTVFFGLPILLVAFTVAAMNTGTIMKRPMGSGDNVDGSIQAVANLALTERWDEASTAMEQVHKAWDKVRGRIHLTSATDEMEIFDLELAGLQGAIDGRDTTQVRIAVRRLTTLWSDLGS